MCIYTQIDLYTCVYTHKSHDMSSFLMRSWYVDQEFCQKKSKRWLSVRYSPGRPLRFKGLLNLKTQGRPPSVLTHTHAPPSVRPSLTKLKGDGPSLTKLKRKQRSVRLLLTWNDLRSLEIACFFFAYTIIRNISKSAFLLICVCEKERESERVRESVCERERVREWERVRESERARARVLALLLSLNGETMRIWVRMHRVLPPRMSPRTCITARTC